jgi:hypothetical protein
MLAKRIKNESPETRRKWDSAVRTLRKGDHYILVMLVREPVRGTRPQRVEHVAAILAAPLFYSLVLFNSRGNLKRGQTPRVDKYLPVFER